MLTRDLPPVSLLDTSKWGGSCFSEKSIGTSFANPGEVTVAWGYILLLVALGVPPGKIALICMYKAQVRNQLILKI